MMTSLDIVEVRAGMAVAVAVVVLLGVYVLHWFLSEGKGPARRAKRRAERHRAKYGRAKR